MKPCIHFAVSAFGRMRQINSTKLDVTIAGENIKMWEDNDRGLMTPCGLITDYKCFHCLSHHLHSCHWTQITVVNYSPATWQQQEI